MLIKNPADSALLNTYVTEAVKGPVRYELLWQGNRDGFGCATFHYRCNKKGPTLTVILSNNDKIFGGYTSLSWQNRQSSVQDTTAFIYSLTNKAKCATQKNSSSIADYSSSGPCFGSGYDIDIYDNCNTNAYPSYKHFAIILEGIIIRIISK